MFISSIQGDKRFLQDSYESLSLSECSSKLFRLAIHPLFFTVLVLNDRIFEILLRNFRDGLYCSIINVLIAVLRDSLLIISPDLPIVNTIF